MTEIQRKGNRVRRILETKKQTPEYQRLDIEPKEGGKSLLHDEFGIPKVSTYQRKEKALEPSDISNRPVHVKASLPIVNTKSSSGIPKRGTPLIEEEDDFVPPRSNFVAVGQKEHTWYAPEVAGPRPSSVDQKEIIDNNDEIDVDALQGTDPFIDLKEDGVSEIREEFEKTLGMIEEQSLLMISTVKSPEDLKVAKATIFGKNSDLTAILREFKNIPPNERRIVGEIINYTLENIKLELSSKGEEFVSAERVRNTVPAPESSDSHDVEDEDEDEDENEDEEHVPSTAKISSLQDGHYAVFIDDKLFNTFSDTNSVREILSRLILGNNIDVTRIQVIKRIPIDFGVVLGD